MGFLNSIGKYLGFNSFMPFGLRLFNITPIFNNYGEDIEKLRVIFKNPALLKVFTLQCDLFSLGQIVVKDKEGNPIPDDPAIMRLNNPNPLQQRTQFLWDFMFWNMVGTDYCYIDSLIVDKDSNKLYFLEPQKIEWPVWLQQNSDKLIFSSAKQKELFDTVVKYRYNDGSAIDIQLSKILVMTDLTNGMGNWFKSPSRIDALYKVITNSEETLNSDNINIRYAGKFMVAGQADPENVTQMPMGVEEKEDIERKIDNEQPVHAVKSMIDIKRFVENMAQLQLSEKYLHQYFIIGNMFNIPRDVLEAYNSSTYENQEKARASHVSYTLQPKGDDFMQALADKWGYTEQGKIICISWAHLPFNQVFESERATKNKDVSIAFANFLNAGVSLDEINAYIGTNFKTGEKAQVKSAGTLKQEPATPKGN